MRVLFIPSAVRKPFGSIDHWTARAWRESGHTIKILFPGAQFKKRLHAAVAQFRPQLLFAMLGNKWKREDCEEITHLSIPSGIWYTDDPYAIDESLRTCTYFRHVWTNERAAVPVYQGVGCQRVTHLPLGVETRVYRPRSVVQRYRSDVLILGSAFENRLRVVESLLPILVRYRLRIVGPGWQRLPSYRNIRHCVISGWVSPLEASRYYNGAKVVLNIHRTADDTHLKQNRLGVPAETPNNRVLEIGACRSFQIVTKRKGMSDLLPDGIIPAYQSLSELKDRIREALCHPQYRRERAWEVYRRVIQDHRYQKRILRMIRDIDFAKIGADQNRMH